MKIDSAKPAEDGHTTLLNVEIPAAHGATARLPISSANQRNNTKHDDEYVEKYFYKMLMHLA